MRMRMIDLVSLLVRPYISIVANCQFTFRKAAVPSTSEQPTAQLLCTNLPQEVTDDVLSVIFQQ